MASKIDDSYEIDENGEKYLLVNELDLSTLYPQHEKDFKNGAKYIIVGKPGTGKSTIIESIMYSKKHIIPVAQIFSGTEDSNGFFGRIIPNTFIFDGLDTERLEHVINFRTRQKAAKEYLEKNGDNPWSMQIIDDCGSDVKFLTKPIFKEIYKNGRHWRIMHILSLQYCMDIKPDIRAAIDGVFILRESNPKMRQKLWENYGSCIPTLEEFCNIMDELTEDYTCIFITNKTQSNKIKDCLFYYKADPSKLPKDWKFGCEDYWNYHYDRYNQDYTPNIV